MIDKIDLRETCSACPEQYDAYLDGKQVGYLRLRHGYFRVDYPNCGGEVIYEAEPIGDGCFDSGERDYYLTEAKRAIARRISRDDPSNSKDNLLAMEAGTKVKIGGQEYTLSMDQTLRVVEVVY